MEAIKSNVLPNVNCQSDNIIVPMKQNNSCGGKDVTRESLAGRDTCSVLRDGDNMETKLPAITELAQKRYQIGNDLREEPYAGKLHVRFCEGLPIPFRGLNGGYSTTYSPDGKTIATGSADKTVKVWDLRSLEQGKDPMVIWIGTSVLELFLDGAKVRAVRGLSKDNRRLLEQRTGNKIGVEGEYEILYFKEQLENNIKNLGLKHPSTAQSCSGLGMAYFSSACYKEAAECFKKALEIDPENEIFNEQLKMAEKKNQHGKDSEKNKGKDKSKDSKKDKKGDCSISFMAPLNKDLITPLMKNLDDNIEFKVNLIYTGSLNSGGPAKYLLPGGPFSAGCERFLEALNQNIDQVHYLKNDLAKISEIEIRVTKKDANPGGAAQFHSFKDGRLIMYLAGCVFDKPQTAALGAWVEIYRALKNEHKDKVFINSSYDLDYEELGKVYKRYAVVLSMVDRDKLVSELKDLEDRGILRTDFSEFKNIIGKNANTKVRLSEIFNRHEPRGKSRTIFRGRPYGTEQEKIFENMTGDNIEKRVKYLEEREDSIILLYAA